MGHTRNLVFAYDRFTSANNQCPTNYQISYQRSQMRNMYVIVKSDISENPYGGESVLPCSSSYMGTRNWKNISLPLKFDSKFWNRHNSAFNLPIFSRSPMPFMGKLESVEDSIDAYITSHNSAFQIQTDFTKVNLRSLLVSISSAIIIYPFCNYPGTNYPFNNC